MRNNKLILILKEQFETQTDVEKLIRNGVDIMIEMVFALASARS